MQEWRTAQSMNVVARFAIVGHCHSAITARAEFVTTELLLVVGNLGESGWLDLVNRFGFLFFL
ncbi:MAG TPA: hypothetical protein VGK72_10555, partial [Chthoniobacterales bacterium]